MPIEQYNKIVNINSPDTLYKLANFYSKTNKTKAIHYLNKILTINPLHHKSHSELAKLYQYYRKNKKAICHLEYSLNIKQNKNIKTSIIKKLINLYIQEQMFDNAGKLLIKRLAPFGDFGYIATLKNKIKNIIPKNKYQNKIQKEYQKEYRNTLFTIAYILREKGKHNNALKYAKKLLKTNKQNKKKLAYIYLIATIYECKKDFRKADLYFRRIKPTHPRPNTSADTYEVIYQKIKNSGLC